MKMENKCIFWKKGKCNSIYGGDIKCDGINKPEYCVYDLEKELEKVLQKKNKGK